MHWSVLGMLAEKVKVNNVTSNKIKWYTKSHPRHAWQIEFNESNEIKNSVICGHAYLEELRCV